MTKEHLSLASEFAAASELCRRGMYAQLTLGTHKRTDLLVESHERMLRIQVKGKQRGEWPAVKGLYQPDSLLVLVDFKGKSDTERPDFYVLTMDDWSALLDRELIQKGKVGPGKVRIDDTNTPIGSDGYRGMIVKVHMVATHKDQWGKVMQMLGLPIGH